MTTVEQVERLYAAVIEDAEKGDYVANLFLKHCDPYEWLSEEERERARVMAETALESRIEAYVSSEDYAQLHHEEVAMRKAEQRKRKKNREKNRKAKERQSEQKRFVRKAKAEKKKSKRSSRGKVSKGLIGLIA